MIKRSTKDKREGAFRELRGKLRQKVGQPTNSPPWKPRTRRKDIGKNAKENGRLGKSYRNLMNSAEPNSPATRAVHMGHG